MACLRAYPRLTSTLVHIIAVQDPMNAVDFLAIFPFYIETALLYTGSGGTGANNTRIIRLIRLLRVLRLLRLWSKWVGHLHIASWARTQPPRACHADSRT